MNTRETTFILSFLVLILSLSPIVLNLKEKNYDPFDVRHLFLIYFGLQLGVYPLCVEIFDVDYAFISKHSPRDRYDLNLALVYSFCGLIFYQLGYQFISIQNCFTKTTYWIADRARLQLVSIILLFVAASSFYFTYLENGFTSYLDNFNGLRYGSIEKNLVISFMATSMPCYAGVFMYGACGNFKSNPFLFRWTILALLVLSMLAGFLSGFRSVLAPLILTIVASIHYNHKRLTKLSVVITLVALFIFNSLYGSYREAFESNKTFRSENDRSAILGLVLRSNALDVTAVTISLINSDVVRYAGLFAGVYEAVTIVVPRKIWSAKPVPQSIVFSETVFNQPNGGISMSIIGYLYYQYGFIMIFFGTFIFGGLSALMQKLFEFNRECLAVKSLYIVLVGLFPKFAEAPQETSNTVVLCSVTLTMILWASASKRKRIGSISVVKASQ
jgi:hypothetical protein